MAFKYDEVIGKLEQFSDKSQEKQLKLLKKVLTDEDYLMWQFDPGKDHAAYSNEMISKFYTLLAKPAPLRMYPKLLDRYSERKFTRTSVVVLNAILTFALRMNADMVETIREEINENGNSVEVREKRARAEKYAERIDGVKEMIQTLIKPCLKTLSRDTGLSKDMIYRALMVAPDQRYIPKHRITPLVMQTLAEMYDEAGITGFPNRGAGVRWDPLFKEIFGVENISSVAVNVLLEGVHHIDKYRESKNLGAIRDCWDSLTMWALNVLEHTNDNVRSQMIGLYLKKAENLIARRQGRPTDMRVNLTQLSNEFSNLVRTVNLYRDQFSGLFSKVRFGDDRNRDRDRNDRRDDRRDRDQDRRDQDREESTPAPVSEKDLSRTDDTPFDLGDAFDKAMDTAGSIADTLSRLAGDDED